MKRQRISTTMDLILLIIFTIAAISFTLELYFSTLLPWFALIALIVILLLIAIVYFVSILSYRKHKWLRRFFLGAFTCILLVALSFLYQSRHDEDIVNENLVNKYAMHLITRQKHDSIKDFHGQKIGYLSSDSNHLTEITEQFKEQDSKAEFIQIENYQKMIEAWNNDELQGVFVSSVNEALLAHFDDQYENIHLVEEVYEISEIDLSEFNKQMMMEPFVVLLSLQDNEEAANIVSSTNSAFLICVNPNTKKIELITLPDSLYLSSLAYDGLPDKLSNLSYSGLDNLILSLENSFEIQIDGYLRLNRTAFFEMINSLNRIKTNIHSSFCVEDICFEEGSMELTGEEAYIYTNYEGEGQSMKSIAQLNVMEAILNSLISLKNPNQAISLLNNALLNSICNLDLTQSRNFMMNFLTNLSDWEITLTALNAGKMIQMPCASWELREALDVYVMGKEDVAAIFEKYHNIRSNETLADFSFSLNQISKEYLLPENYKNLVTVENYKKKLIEYFALQPSSTVNPVVVEQYQQQTQKIDPNFDPQGEVIEFK